MTGPTAVLTSDGTRLHLQHGPIDLIIGADGDRNTAFTAAKVRFIGLLDDLVDELPLLRARLSPFGPSPSGSVARRMDFATRPFSEDTYLTRMAAVAGSVADEVLDAMCSRATLERAYVNNGGDIALHLGPDASFTTAMADHIGRDLGRITCHQSDSIRGIATSGRHGRSLSRGIADSVTVLARNAAQADAAATLIANAVDLPDHPGVKRRPAHELTDEGDLGALPVVIHCDTLSSDDVAEALTAGLTCAQDFMRRGLILGASLHLQGVNRTTQTHQFTDTQRITTHA